MQFIQNERGILQAFNKISPNLASFHAQILGLKFGEIYTQIWRIFSKFFVSKKYVKFLLIVI